MVSIAAAATPASIALVLKRLKGPPSFVVCITDQIARD
jgi:hypothetical protein